MAAIAQLKALLGMDTAQYRAGMRTAESATDKFKKSISDAGKTIATAFSVMAIVRFTKSVVDFASEIRHTADNLNVTTDALQALNSTALKYGMSIDDQTKMLSKLRQAQGKVAEGDKEYVDALRLLNIESNKFANADTAEALEMVARAYSDANGDALAFSAAQDLLGRAGKKATAFLQELATVGIDGVTESARKAGTIIEDELITKLELLGTRNEQILLRIKVGWAETLDVIGSGAKAIAAQAAVAAEQTKQAPWWQKVLEKTPMGGAVLGVKRLLSKEAVAAGAGEIQGATPSATAGRSKRRPDTIAGDADAHVMAWMAAQKQASDERFERALKLADEKEKINRVFESRRQGIMDAPFSATGRDIRHDQMAAVGGMVGGNRADAVGIADKQLQKAIEMVRRLDDIAKINREQKEQLTELNERNSGGAPG